MKFITCSTSAGQATKQSTEKVMMRAERIGWRDGALCDGDLASYFFPPNHFERKPEKDRRESVARALCGQCPVRQACLDYAITVREPHGIWGGLNELERRRLIRRLDLEACPA